MPGVAGVLLDHVDHDPAQARVLAVAPRPLREPVEARAAALGYTFRYPELDIALRGIFGG